MCVHRGGEASAFGYISLLFGLSMMNAYQYEAYRNGEVYQSFPIQILKQSGYQMHCSLSFYHPSIHPSISHTLALARSFIYDHACGSLFQSPESPHHYHHSFIIIIVRYLLELGSDSAHCVEMNISHAASPIVLILGNLWLISLYIVILD